MFIKFAAMLAVSVGILVLAKGNTAGFTDARARRR